jgi:leucyl/phenylalanyl-tRNA--protein transferase
MNGRAPVYFPPVWTADEDGLLMIGGELSVAWLRAAYHRGIFPWPIDFGQMMILAWFSPDPRAILDFDQLHVSRRLARRMRGDRFRVTFNTDFASVMAGCAEPRSDDPDGGTWITPEMLQAYREFHAAGGAHSVEVWRDEQLVGGLYGVAVGGAFSAESMFHRETDASKIALVALVERLRERGFTLLDIQQATPHMTRMGATEIARHDFLRRLRKARNLPVTFA